jgi:alanyl-tRNA synthetase
MTANELRQKYLDFFKSKGHRVLPSASLIPENDPTVLFTTAGMHPLVAYLMGEKHPSGPRLTNVQKCIRTSDIDEVGDTTHHTFFEMLGNWSLGDYFKNEAIEWSWEFLTSPDWLGLDKNRMAVSVFAGDNDAPFDAESFNFWNNKIGISEKRIAKLPKANNWWGPAGLTGPCGPDTEMFYWVGDPNKVPEVFNDDSAIAGWVEIWNDVFMQYNKKPDGSYLLLKQKNVDTGMGMERVLAILNGYDDNYQSELFYGIIKTIENLSQKKYDESNEIKRAVRIIADHIKAATFIIGDDKAITPSNTDQGYIVRRLIRRAIRYSKILDIEDNFTKKISVQVINIYKDTYPELEKNKDRIFTEIENEENKFRATLERGLKELKYRIANLKSPSQNMNVKLVPGLIIFDLYQSYGFPIEMTKELANEEGLEIDEVGFKEELKKHQELSRSASAGMFKGGLADAGEETKKLHTAAHLMLAALRKILGDQVFQRGSNITAERLRFDFSYSDKMTEEQKQQVENLVNEAIKNDYQVICEEVSLDDARKKNAMGIFESKYGEKVKVYTIGESIQNKPPFSCEICGGPHAENTGQLGHFKIIKEESSSAGVRRIKAILE